MYRLREMGGFARRAISLIQKYAFALKGQVQTTTGLETNDYWSVLKRLFVSYANNYSIALRANSGLSAIDYCFTPPPQEGSLSEATFSIHSLRGSVLQCPDDAV